MSDGLDVIVVDDDLNVCEILTDIVRGFYTWGDVFSFSDVDVATSYCNEREVGVGCAGEARTPNSHHSLFLELTGKLDS